jgi:hypothetical protein
MIMLLVGFALVIFIMSILIEMTIGAIKAIIVLGVVVIAGCLYQYSFNSGNYIALVPAALVTYLAFVMANAALDD